MTRAIAASIARLVLYVQLIQAALANESVDQNRTFIPLKCPKQGLMILNRGADLVHVLEHA